MSGAGTSRLSGLSTAFREVVSAFLGIAVIVAILILLWPFLSRSPPDTGSAQGVFAILGGWGGVVLGYYFGRLPSEKAADKASQAADSARKEKDVAEKDKTFNLATYITQLENHKKSLEANNGKLKEFATKQKEKGPAAESLENVIKEIDAEIAGISTEKQRFQDMAK